MNRTELWSLCVHYLFICVWAIVSTPLNVQRTILFVTRTHHPCVERSVIYVTLTFILFLRRLGQALNEDAIMVMVIGHGQKLRYWVSIVPLSGEVDALRGLRGAKGLVAQLTSWLPLLLVRLTRGLQPEGDREPLIGSSSSLSSSLRTEIDKIVPQLFWWRC